MRSLKRHSRAQSVEPAPVTEFDPEAAAAAGDSDGDSTYDTYEMFRVICPDCVQPIALLADEDVLPEHALCPTPWNPFGLTVCTGTGRGVAETKPADEVAGVQEQAVALLLTLPEELDWRTQPFSHVGGAGSRPIHVTEQGRPAA